MGYRTQCICLYPQGAGILCRKMGRVRQKSNMNRMSSQDCKVVAMRRDNKLPYIIRYWRLDGLSSISKYSNAFNLKYSLYSLVHVLHLQHHPYGHRLNLDAIHLVCHPRPL